MDFEANIVEDGYGTWKIVEKDNDCYIAKGFGLIKDNEDALEIGFRNQPISVMRMMNHHFYSLSIALIRYLKHLPEDTQLPEELQGYKNCLKIQK
jgi:hypothetical protein